MKPLRLSVAESGRCGFLPASKVACRRKFATAGAGDCGRSAFSLRYAAPGEYGRSYVFFLYLSLLWLSYGHPENLKLVSAKISKFGLRLIELG